MLWLSIGYMFLFIHRPFEIWPMLGSFRLELLYMLGVGAVWLAAPNKRLSCNSLHVAVFCFAAAVLLCSLLSPWSDHCLDDVDPFLKFLVFFLMLISSVHTEKNLKRLVLGFLVVVTGYMLHSLWEFSCGRHVSRMGIIRLIGVDTSSSDPNSFAASILLALVLVPAVWKSHASSPIRGFLAGYTGLSLLCILLTGSRGAFIGLIVWVLVAVWQSQWRSQLMFLVVLAAPLMFLALPDRLQQRFETIVDPSVGPRNAKQSGDARIEGFFIGLQLWQDNPLAGIGPGAWKLATRRQLESHNLYGQLVGELGSLGALTFGSLLLAYLFNLRSIRQTYRDHPEWEPDFSYHLARAIGLALFLLLLFGAFGHNLFRYNWFLYAAFLSIARHCTDQRASAWNLEPEYPWDEELASPERRDLAGAVC